MTKRKEDAYRSALEAIAVLAADYDPRHLAPAQRIRAMGAIAQHCLRGSLCHGGNGGKP
jgi:hypothetical protein